MLERISEVQCVGLLYEANGKPYTLKKATFIYADNGRGKSTLASIFQSLSTGDISKISNRKTVDGTLPQKVTLQFNNGHKVAFENGAWTQLRPEIYVFDTDFIDRNVHSGGAVNTDHRKNLLEFALGEPAVAARLTVEKTTAKAKSAAEKLQGLITKISGFHNGISIEKFESLPAIADVDVKMADVRKRIAAAGNVAKILLKPSPTPLNIPEFDIDLFFSTLSLSLKDVHLDAEQVVKNHIAKLGKQTAESWLSQGQQFDDSKTCPYCAQETSDNNLILAYQTHFNTAYNDLKTKVAGIVNSVATGTADNIINVFSQAILTASALAASWSEYTEVQTIQFENTNSVKALAELQNILISLAKQKQLTPTESIGSEQEKQQAKLLWNQVVNPMIASNSHIKGISDAIIAYKAKLQTEDVGKLNLEISHLEFTKTRYEAVVLDLFKLIVAARADLQLVEKEKKKARETLDQLMTATLSKYETSINALLKKFGASFSIKGMSANFRGASPRSDYGLLLRGKDVPLEGGPPSFSTALSEGDKRTLAFAFFIASAVADPNIGSKTIVIDDPMCSLDLNRRQHTRAVLRKVNEMSEQLIVLAHDPYFLRDLRDFFLKADKLAQIADFQLVQTKGDYSNFEAIDLDKECESVYFRHHRMLNEFLDGNIADSRSVAKAIRPMLEGYLHRRFPGRVPKDLLFGQVVILIRDALPTNPLSHAKNLVNELNEINDYAGQFHHDTNPDHEAVPVNNTELKTFLERALNVVHRGT